MTSSGRVQQRWSVRPPPPREPRPKAAQRRSGASLGVPALLAPSTASVALVKAFSASPANLVVDFDIRIDTEDFRDPRQSVMLLSVTFPRGQIAIARGRSGLSLASFDESVSAEAPSSEPLAVGVWRRVSLLLTAAAGEHKDE